MIQDVGAAYESAPWWKRAAFCAFARGDFRELLDRSTGELYLVRFWLSPPKHKADGQLASENSLLLHWIVRPDPGEEFHDHPWQFSSEVLSGGISESIAMDDPGRARPTWRTLHRPPNSRVVHSASTFHRVWAVDADTWTLVRTGRLRNSDWSFLLPGGEKVIWRDMPGVGTVAREVVTDAD